MVYEIKNKEDFEEKVLKGKGLVVVDFWAEWCGPCRMLAPIFEKLSNEMEDVEFVKVNVDENQELASMFNVMSIPTIIVFRDGEIVDQALGALPEEMLKEFINKNK